MEQNSESTTGRTDTRLERELQQRIHRILNHIQHHIDQIKQQVTETDQPTGSYPNTLSALPPHVISALNDFQKFFTAYSSYFQSSGIRQSQRYTAHVLATAIKNTRSTWETLVRAISQRFNTCFDFHNDDMIAAELFSRFDQNVFTCTAQDGASLHEPIIYYEKRYHITRFLFSSNPLIGIPLDMVDAPSRVDPAQAPGADSQPATQATSSREASFTSKEDAIAHELGHYFFWNTGRLTEYQQRMQELEQAMSNEVLKGLSLRTGKNKPINVLQTHKALNLRFSVLATWLSWIDELFADIVGTLLRGPVYVLSSQDLHAEAVDTVDDLFKDDGEHPILQLRPMIGLEVLRYIGEQSHNEEFKQKVMDTIAALEGRWQMYLKAVAPGLFDTEVTDEGHYHPDISIRPTATQLQEYIAPVVQVILNTPLTYHSQSKSTLLDCIDYWGRAASEEESQSLDRVCKAASLQTNDLVASFVAAALDAGKDALQMGKPALLPLVDNTSPLFDLVEFIRQRQANGQTTAEEWQELLKLNLVISLGHIGEKDENGDPLPLTTPDSHKHTQAFEHFHRGITIRTPCPTSTPGCLNNPKTR